MAHLFQINISKGSVPKRPVHEAEVTELGVVGDRQEHSEIHGGADRAICLFSLEKIIALQEEGHPIFPGSTGENLTITGVNWDEIKPNIQMAIGGEVVLEMTKPTQPCKQIRPSFSDENSNRILEDKMPGWSRYYARVLKTGKIKTGDKVRIL